jgi:coenzyme Q-binding protein COQ10
VDFAVDFEFRSRILDKAASAVFGQAVKRAIAAFENRAAALYASSSPSANSTA